MSDTYRVRISTDWLPLPDAILGGLQWREGDEIELEVVGDCVIARLAENPTPRPTPPLHPPPRPRRPKR